MKVTVFFSLMLLSVSMSLCVAQTDAEYEPYTQWGLPEGAKARLGKGRITGNVTYSPDGTRLAVASSIGIWLYDVQTGEELDLLTGHTDSVNSVSFSPDGETLASGSWDYTVRLWDVATGDLILTLTGHTYWVNSVSFSPDGTTIASGGWVDTIRLWDVETGAHLRTLEGHTLGAIVSFSPDGATLTSESRDTIRLWDVATGDLIRTLEGHTDYVNSVSFSPDGVTLASGGSDKTIRLWDVATGDLIRTLEGHTGDVNSVSFSPDGQTLASGGSDKTIRLWDVATGDLIRTLTGHTNDVESVAFSPDGTTLASGSDDGTILLWPLAPETDELPRPGADVNDDGAVNIQDLVLVASRFGETGENEADVNGDGKVNIQDLVLVAGAFGTAAAAPTTRHLSILTPETVQQWLSVAEQMELTDVASRRGIAVLRQLLATLIPKETALLSNYPNPFNPETWLPYQLAKPAEVTLTLYDVNGAVVRTLALGHQPAGIYQSQSRAAYWDGRNNLGEPVASGLYFYTLTAGEFTATRKLLIRK